MLVPCPFKVVPSDCIYQILFNLDVEDIKDCSLLCELFRKTIQDDNFWQGLYFRDFECQPKQNNDQSFLQAYQDAYSSEFNLKKGRFTYHTACNLSYMMGRTSTFHISNGLLCLEQLNGNIRVQDLKRNQTYDISSAQPEYFHYNMAIRDDQLFSLRSNNTLDIYDLTTKVCLETLKDPLLRISSFALCDNKLILNNADRNIWVWNIDTKEFLIPISLPLDTTISRMTAFGSKIFLGTNKGEILVLNSNSGEYFNPLTTNKFSEITCLTNFANKLIAASDRGHIAIWDIDTGEYLHTLKHCEYRSIDSLAVVNGKLFSASSDHTIKVWNIKTMECLSTLQTHASNNLSVIDTKIYSGSFSDRKIKVIDFSANHNAILANCAELFREGDFEVRIAMGQFNALSMVVKNLVYEEHYQLLKPFNNDNWGCGEHAFHNQYGYSSTREQKAQSIENYLTSTKKA